MKKIFCSLLISLWASAICAEALELKSDHPESYTVKQGDTLWDISGMYLTEPWRWPEIWQKNPQIENPHLIYPGDILSLVYGKDGVKLTVSERAAIKIGPTTEGGGSGNLSPKVRTQELKSALTAIPLEKITAFLSKSRVVDLEVLDNAPYILASDENRIISGAGDKIFARGDFSSGVKGYGVFRKGATYQDPQTLEVLGVEAIDVGGGRIVSVKNDVASFLLNETTQEIRINDRLLINDERKLDSYFHPKSPKQEVKGVIINVEGGVSQVGALDIVAINIGERNSLEIGDILAIYQRGETINDPVKKDAIQLPDTRAGILIVFRTFDKMSYGLVLSATRALRIGDKLENP